MEQLCQPLPPKAQGSGNGKSLQARGWRRELCNTSFRDNEDSALVNSQQLQLPAKYEQEQTSQHSSMDEGGAHELCTRRGTTGN